MKTNDRLYKTREQRIIEIFEESNWYISMTNFGCECNIPKKYKKELIKGIIQTIKHLVNVGVIDNYDIWLIEYEIDEWLRKWQ